MQLLTKQTELLGGKTEPCHIYSEYYVIKVINFDDIAKDTLDQWIYYLKKNEAPIGMIVKSTGLTK